MSQFFNESEREAFNSIRRTDPVARELLWSLQGRVKARAEWPSLSPPGTTTQWWHHVSEFLTDAALAVNLKKDERIEGWLRSATLSVVRRPIEDWVGPWFRDHDPSDRKGHLETAHLSWSVAVVLDLAPHIFTESEISEIREALKEKGIELCKSWLGKVNRLMNWRSVLTAGVAVAAAVLDDEDSIQFAVEVYQQCAEMFQEDGTSGESLQYANYSAYPLMLTWEALVRSRPELRSRLSLAPMIRMSRWQAASFFYQKPLSGWGSCPLPRSANFNDSAAVFRPSADLLLHWAVRGQDDFPKEAGLARWVFEKSYRPLTSAGVHDRASFGFVSDFGFLSIPLLAASADKISPPDAGVDLTVGFDCGDMITRDQWEGKTILAVKGVDQLQNGPNHFHQDLNSFILVHNRERLLVDPGHSCYRNLIHSQVEMKTYTHNTCHFFVSSTGKVVDQRFSTKRHINLETGELEPPVDRGGDRLLLERDGDVSIMGCDAARGPHVLFLVDRVRASEPVSTVWNFLLNDRDGQLEENIVPPDRFVARRGSAGMKVFHCGEGTLIGPEHAYVHDAYHPLPGQVGEGRPGSGMLLHFRDRNPKTLHLSVHAICVDDYGQIAGWHLRKEPGYAAVLEDPTGQKHYRIKIESDDRFLVETGSAQRSYTCSSAESGKWHFAKL